MQIKISDQENDTITFYGFISDPIEGETRFSLDASKYDFYRPDYTIKFIWQQCLQFLYIDGLMFEVINVYTNFMSSVIVHPFLGSVVFLKLIFAKNSKT